MRDSKRKDPGIGDSDASCRYDLIRDRVRELLLALFVGCLASTPAVGQLPAACVSTLGDRSTIPWNLSEGDDPFLNGLPERLIQALRETPASREEQVSGPGGRFAATLRSATAESRVAVEYALAALIADDGGGGLASFREALRLIRVYRDFSGRAEPMLFILQMEGADTRIPIALSAIRPPVDSASQARILAIACAQAGFALSVARDPLIRDLLAGRNRLMVTVGNVLQRSVNLTTGARRAVLEDLKAVVDSALGRW